MLDDGHSVFFAVGKGRALGSFLGIAPGRVIGAGRDPQAHEPGVDAGLVHHLEHFFHAALGLAQKDAPAGLVLAEFQSAGGRGVQAHFLLQAHALHVVGPAQAAVRLHPYLGHYEKADALGALGSAFYAGQHQVDDVFGEVLLAAGDETFLSGDFVDAGIVRLRVLYRRAFQPSHVRAGMRLGEAHGAAPFAPVEVFAEQGAVPVRAKGFYDARVAHGEAAYHDQRQVGAHQKLAQQAGGHRRQAGPAVFRVVVQGYPAARAELVPGFVKGRRHLHLAALLYATGAVAVLQAGAQHLLRQGHAPGQVFFQGLPVEFGIGGIGKNLIQTQLFKQKEFKVTRVALEMV